MNTSPGTAIRSAGNRALVTAFLLAICVPGTVQLLGLSENGTETVEKRKPAPFPEVELRWWGDQPVLKPRRWDSFPQRFESYYNDHVGLRRWLIRGYNRARFNGFTPAVLDNPFYASKYSTSVLVGKQGWLYYTADRSIESFRGSNLFKAEELQQWKEALRARRDRLARHGVRYILTIPPDKQTIYPEYLPAWIQRVETTSRLDQLLEAVRNEPGIEIVDLREALRNSKSVYPVYFRTDTHWTNFGAFVACQQLMQRVARFLPAAEPDRLDDYDVRVQESDEAHDLRVMLDVPLSDVAVDLLPRRPRSARLVSSSESKEVSTSENPHAPLGRAVVLHDSFFLQVQPFFSEHWRQVTYLTTRQIPWETILEDPPQLVLEELVERKLMVEVLPQ